MLSISVYITSIPFSLFFLIFWLYLHWLLYLEMCTDHVHSSGTSPRHPYFFPDFFPIFSTENAKLAIFGNFWCSFWSLECSHELEVLVWLWGDYGGNYGSNLGPSHNLLIMNSCLLSTRYPTFSYIIIIIILYNYGIHLSPDQLSMSVRQVSKPSQGSRQAIFPASFTSMYVPIIHILHPSWRPLYRAWIVIGTTHRHKKWLSTMWFTAHNLWSSFSQMVNLKWRTPRKALKIWGMREETCKYTLCKLEFCMTTLCL